jgi:enterochelin esterase-like enzyme
VNADHYRRAIIEAVIARLLPLVSERMQTRQTFGRPR